MTTFFDDSTPVSHLEGTDEIHAGTCSFTRFMSGIFNTHNAVVVLNGEVIEGSADFVGAQAHLEGEMLVGPDSICSAGTSSVTPR